MLKTIFLNKSLRSIFEPKFQKYLYNELVINTDNPLPKPAREDFYNGIWGMYLSALRNVDKGYIKKHVMKKIMDTLVSVAMIDNPEYLKIKKTYLKKYGVGQPSFFVLSPTKWCNLKCSGCYASSSSAEGNTLEWDLVNKIMKDAHDNLGMRFFVISGGEPMAYKSKGKTILDLFRKYSDSYFMMYTNGTMITQKVAEEMAKLGNITPAISVEGYEKETDARRGKGVFKKILAAFEHLKKAGVPFGVSVTATKKNVEVFMKDKFYDYYFLECGATYMWMFQCMPIGRAYELDLMMTPEQRFKLFKVWRHILKDKHYFVADFWNSANMSKGCISCGKSYFYIDWDGKILPCVFIPYYKDTVQEIYKKGKKLENALMGDFFKGGREWQENYLHGDKHVGNTLMPCFIRDHHKEFFDLLKKTKMKPEDKSAEEAFKDDKFHKWLMDYDKKLEGLTQPYWKKEYLDKDKDKK